jgi:hypothetical protein
MRRRRPPRRLLPRRIALVEPDLERSHAAILARPYHGRYPSFTLMRIGRYTSFTLMRMRMSRSSISCRVVEAPAALRGRSCTTTRLPPPSWAPAHAQPAGTRQNRHRLMSSSVPNMCGHEAAQSDLSAPSPPRSPTSALHLLRDRRPQRSISSEIAAPPPLKRACLNANTKASAFLGCGANRPKIFGFPVTLP